MAHGPGKDTACGNQAKGPTIEGTSSPTQPEDGPEDSYPEGGTFQAYIASHQLHLYSVADVGWIFGLYLFVAYFSGIQTGPLFDSQGPKWLMVAGTLCLVAAMMLLSICTGYYQFILVFSILGGLGTSLISSPAIASIGHFFCRRRGLASGIASCGGSLGGMIFPSMLSSLFATVGFPWAVRVLGFVFLVLLIFATMAIGSRLPRRPLSRKDVLPDLSIFTNNTFLVMTIAIFLVEWGLFVPLSYLTSFALAAGIERGFAYQLLTILNVGSFFGRWAPGLLADKIGRFNTMIIMITLCFATTMMFWLPATQVRSKAKPLSTVFALIFGFASGSNISLGPVCAGQLCTTEDYGRFFATCYTLVGLGTLVGIPIAGAILKRDGNSYSGLVAFTAASYFVGLCFFIWARVRVVGWSIRKNAIY